ncbi:MFS transporter [Streptomyces sp. NBC_00287]|uniref:MFS transporter n=1 Tax=Streptomyces sp. NBC_00287 TaxID=2975702 RepID=UPI002E2E1E77|nr:MFS transporter [Streptomyces sp. NBC_00287]
MSFLGRLPTATIQFGSVLLVARTSGSLAAAGLTGGALAIGQVVCGPLVGRLADRHGQRTVVLACSLANALAITALVAGALAGLGTPWLALLGACAGASVPLIGPLARARLIALARRDKAPEPVIGAALSLESTLDEISFVLGPALVGLAAVVSHPAHALLTAALLVSLCGTAFALHPTAMATRPAAEGRAVVSAREGRARIQGRAARGGLRGLLARAKAQGRMARAQADGRMARAQADGRTARAQADGRMASAMAHGRTARAKVQGRAPRTEAPGRMPRAVHSLRAALALQGAMFGACQAGITALTERLGRPEQAGLVYAAMGVMSAVAGLAMAAVPARVGLTARWRAATGAAFVLSLPLLWTGSLVGLYAAVTVLGVAYAPHLITVFGLTERVVPPGRLAEAMAVATSALVGGQALAVAVTGRLAETYGPTAAFGAASLAAALACALALTAPAGSYASKSHARVPVNTRP